MAESYWNAVCIQLTKGMHAIVDCDDYDAVVVSKWNYSSRGYAKAKYQGKTIHMHRLVMRATDRQHVDHANCNKLDNRKSNLRLCTKAQNAMNTGKSYGRSSRYKGVTYHKATRTWQAQIKVGGKNIYLGVFLNEDDAGVAYNVAALQHFREFSRLNYILNATSEGRQRVSA